MSDSSTLRRQRWLLAFCAIGFIIWAFSFFQDTMWGGRRSLSWRRTSVAFHVAVTAVAPGGAAAKAGIKPGDIVNLQRASAPDRWRFWYPYARDESLNYAVLRGATERHVTLRPQYSRMDTSSWSWYLGALGALIFATIIAWRRPWMVEARILSLLLVAEVVRSCLSWNNFVTPWAGLDFGAMLVDAVVFQSYWFLLTVYTLLFGRPISMARKAITALAFTSFGFNIILDTATYWGIWTGRLDLWNGPIGMSLFLSIYGVVSWVAPALVIAAAMVATRGRERYLLVWTTALPLLNSVVAVVASTAGYISALASNQLFFDVLHYIANGTQFLAPFAIGYALLSRSRFSPMTAPAGTMA